MPADAVDQVAGRVAGWIECLKFAEDVLVAVRGGPVQLDPRALRQPDGAETDGRKPVIVFSAAPSAVDNESGSLDVRTAA